MLSKVKSYGLQGIKGYEVQVEIDINNGLPGIEMVGLPDTAIKESKERVRSAVRNSGYLFSPKKITVNLAPADTKKEGPLYDLPMAIGILCATEQMNIVNDEFIIIGELSLDGNVRHVKGILPIIISARERGHKKIIVPCANAAEAAYIEGVEVYTVSTLRQTVEFLTGAVALTPIEKADITAARFHARRGEDFKYVKGQFSAKRALEIAAAGGHNILMIGPPGAGKTMLARCLPSILPDMTISEALETTKIHSVAGVLDESEGIITERPFRSPHHTVSRAALTGGGQNVRPGEISLAHNGVLFLDELLEYPRTTLEILRQPLEDCVITIARALKSVEYPANFMLVASMNPCPCGNFGSKTHECNCSPADISRYMSRLSGPLLDRIDLHIEVDNVTYDDLAGETLSECSTDIKKRVNIAREIQLTRFANSPVYSNARMNNDQTKAYCRLDAASENLMRSAFTKLGLSARAYNRILKVARTIADLEGEKNIMSKHISEAIQYRTLDRSAYK